MDKTTANAGEKVQITITPNSNYVLDTVYVDKMGGGSISISPDSTFIMPFGYDVQVGGQFKMKASIETVSDNFENRQWSLPKTIVVSYTEGSIVEIYNIASALLHKVYGETSIPATSGIYIVKIGNKIYKLAVE